MWTLAYFGAASAHASNQFLLITSDLEVMPIRLVALDETHLHFTEQDDGHASLPLDTCIAILKEQPAKAAATGPGLLRLIDGRRFPGEPATPRRSEVHESNEVFAWHSSWLGRLEVRLDEIESIVLRPLAGGGSPPLPAPKVGAGRRSDVLILANGDVLEGFIARIREKAVLEVEEGSRAIEMPLDRIAAIRMVAPPRGAPDDRRAWLADGTNMSVSRIVVDEGGMARLAADGATGGTRLDVRHLSAVLLSPGRMLPLSSLEPAKVSGPETRYVIPEPRATDDDALLGLSPIELRGPIRIEYELPGGASRFAAEVTLPESSRHWGDFELIVRDGEREVFTANLSATNPAANVNVPLTGSTLTIELAEGPHGAIHNHVILNRAMLRMD